MLLGVEQQQTRRDWAQQQEQQLWGGEQLPLPAMATTTLFSDRFAERHGRLLVLPQRLAMGLRTTLMATDIDTMRLHPHLTRTASQRLTKHRLPLSIPTRGVTQQAARLGFFPS